jgi:RNA recognition motif-containing protein
MSHGSYTVEITSLSPNASEKDLFDFFAFSGKIQHIEIVRSSEGGCTAYVTFEDAYSQETAVLLSGAMIVDQRVCITRWGHYEDEFDFWNNPSYRQGDDADSSPREQSQFVPNAGEAVTMAQEVVGTMLSKGYELSKDALNKAKTFDESHQVSATAAAKVAELSERIGLNDKLFTGVEAARTINEKYHVSENTKSALSAAGRTAALAANSVVNSSYFSKGALWDSNALTRAAQAAADLGSHGSNE